VFDDDDFTAAEQCCACGGGSPAGPNECRNACVDDFPNNLYYSVSYEYTVDWSCNIDHQVCTCGGGEHCNYEGYDPLCDGIADDRCNCDGFVIDTDGDTTGDIPGFAACESFCNNQVGDDNWMSCGGGCGSYNMVIGCMDPDACNYDPLAEHQSCTCESDGSYCTVLGGQCEDCRCDPECTYPDGVCDCAGNPSNGACDCDGNMPTAYCYDEDGDGLGSCLGTVETCPQVSCGTPANETNDCGPDGDKPCWVTNCEDFCDHPDGTDCFGLCGGDAEYDICGICGGHNYDLTMGLDYSCDSFPVDAFYPNPDDDLLFVYNQLYIQYYIQIINHHLD
jgi:hypothetical protein